MSELTSPQKTLYTPESVGSVMAANVPTCAIDDVLSDILHGISLKRWGSVRNVYVVDGQKKLLGYIDLAKLIQSDHTITAGSLMEPAVLFLHPDDDQEKAVFLAVKNDIVTVPVVTANHELLGSVTAHTIIDIMHSEHIEDSLSAAGIRHDKGMQVVKLATERTSLVVKARAPWLVVGLVVGLGLGLISSLFEQQLQEKVALAYFIPVVAYIADSIGTQTEAIAVRALAVMKVNYWRYLLKELFVGITLGTLMGVLGGIGAAVIGKSVEIGVVVALSLFVASMVATVLASLIPILFKLRGKDPALGSGPLATALQDVISVVIYFVFAVWLIH